VIKKLRLTFNLWLKREYESVTGIYEINIDLCDLLSFHEKIFEMKVDRWIQKQRLKKKITLKKCKMFIYIIVLQSFKMNEIVPSLIE
jgi:hypothetical protein